MTNPSNGNRSIYLGAAVFVIVGIIIVLSWRGQNGPPSDMISDLPSASRDARFEGSVIAGTEIPLLDFRQSDFDRAVASNTPILLYFYANWCPECKRETAQALYPAFDRLRSERDALDVVGFRVNFNDSDTDERETALARAYGVAYQHTKVLIKNGNVLSKAPDTWNIERYLKELAEIRTK